MQSDNSSQVTRNRRKCGAPLQWAVSHYKNLQWASARRKAMELEKGISCSKLLAIISVDETWVGRMVFKQKTQEETHWISGWTPHVPELKGASENLANLHFIGNIASGGTACARSSRWLWQQRERAVVPTLLSPASMANLHESPYGKHVLLLPQPLLHCS